MSEMMTGGCACGRVRYTAAVADDDAYLCHCRMCQKASGGVSIAFKNLPKDAVRWEREPDYFRSSPIARRGYCAACGTSLSFDYSDSDKMDLTVGSFDDPARFVPKHHFGSEGLHCAWINTEGLPEHRSDQYPALVERWVKAIGKLPD
jgi:hypothetical protein